ncbi:MAG: GNAT family N-acetyltransferase [Solirubrobacteraceae bacterium]
MSGGDPIVWRAEPHEAPTVARLLVEFRDHNGDDWPSANAFLASVERLIERPDAEFLLAAADGDAPPSAVCQLRYRFSIWVAAEDCWLEDLYVAETSRRRGLGRALVGAAVERARERGARRIELDTHETNAPAVALYESFGFSDASKGTGRSLFMGRRLG